MPVRTSDLSNNYFVDDTCIHTLYKIKNKDSSRMKMKIRVNEADNYIKNNEQCLLEISFSNNKFHSKTAYGFLSFDSNKSSAVIMFNSMKIDESERISKIIKRSFNNINIKIIDTIKIFTKFFAVKNINHDISRYSVDDSRLLIKYNKNMNSFYIEHKVHHRFDLVLLENKFKNILSNTAEFYDNYDKVLNICDRMGKPLLTPYQFSDSDIIQFNRNHEFFDKELFDLYDNLNSKDEHYVEFRNNISNLNIQNLNNTLTIRGVKFCPENKFGVTAYIPIFDNLAIFNKTKFMYCWIKKFDKFDNFYSYLNKLKLLSL